MGNTNDANTRWGFVVRQRLLNRLRTAIQFPITWVNGNPGSGKTVLLNQLLKGFKGKHLFIDIDESPEITVLAILSRLLSLCEGEEKTISPTHTEDVNDALREAREKLNNLDFEILLLIDHLDRLNPAQSQNQLANSLIKTLPANIKVIFSSRNEPPREVIRGLIHRKIQHLEAQEFFISESEQLQILDELDIDPENYSEEVKTVLKLVRGWPAGFFWFTEKLKEDRHSLMSVSHVYRYFRHYFYQEVYPLLDSKAFTLLVRSSMLPVFSQVDLIRLNIMDVQEAAHLFRAKLPFVEIFTTTDNTSYRSILPLFRKILFEHFKKDPDYIPFQVALGKAGDINTSRHEFEAALECYSLFGNWHKATQLASKLSYENLAAAQYHNTQTILSHITEEELSSNAELLYLKGKSLLDSSFEKALECFQRGINRARESGNNRNLALNILGTIEYHLLRMDSLEPVLANLEKLSDLKPEVHDLLRTEYQDSATTLSTALRLIPKWRSEFKDVLNPPGISSSPSTLIAKLAYQLNQELGLVSETRVNRFLQANELLAEIEALNIHETGVATRLIHLKKAIMLSERLLSMKAFKACQQAIDFTKRVSTYGSRQLELDLQLLQAELDNRSEQSNSPFNLIDDAIRKAKMLRCAHILVKGQMILQHKHLASGRLDVVEESFELLSKLCYRLDFPILHLHFGLLRAGFADKKHKNATPYLSIAFDFAERQGILPRYWIDQQALIELLDYGIRNRVCESHCRTFVSSLNLVPQNPRQLCDDWPWAVRIYTFGRFAVLINEEPLILSGKSHQKPLQVLKAIIAFGGRNVSERLICDTLWPGSDRDSSYRTLSTNLHRLRKILGRDDIVEVGGGHVTLNSKLCWVDCWAFEILVNRFHSELASGRATQSADAVVNTMFKLYHGSFLRTDVSTDWIRAFHYKLQSKFSRTISSLGTSLEKLNKHDDAFDLYQRALEIEPSADLLKLKLESGLGANREHSLNG